MNVTPIQRTLARFSLLMLNLSILGSTYCIIQESLNGDVSRALRHVSLCFLSGCLSFRMKQYLSRVPPLKEAGKIQKTTRIFSQVVKPKY